MTLAAVLLAAGCQREPHFMTNHVYRTLVHRDFLKQKELAQGRAEALFGGMDTLGREEREALEFLYAYMPYSDLADYDQSFYLQQIRTAFAARDTFSWGRQVPEDIFRHYVLVYRVNNENLDSARMVFFRELKDRVKGLPMEQAALEVNHWCHEHVDYIASESRTASPLATVRTTTGHCVDESVFAVTAMRAVGIPARMCYTPRWAHGDGGHFWPEVWVIDSAGQGKWRHLGACEPCPKFDLTWMETSKDNHRMMIVCSKVFGRYKGPEEKIIYTSRFSILNVSDRYAPMRKVTVSVLEPGTNGRMIPAKGASVKFTVYNSGEYSSIASVSTDKKGKATISIGLGDVLVWACKGGKYNYRKMDVRQQDTITIALCRDGASPQSYVEEIEMEPPVAGQQRQVIQNNRCAYEDSLRIGYRETFPKINNYKNYLPDGWEQTARFFEDGRVGEILQRAAGNYPEIVKFLCSCAKQGKTGSHVYDYLMSYSDKDLRDITSEVLEDHITDPHDYGFDYAVYKQGLMPAHVSKEYVRPWRHLLAEALKDVATAEELKTWTEENIYLGNRNHYGCPVSPYGVYQLRYSDDNSRDIFYVAACRALGIPAYLDKTMNTIYVWEDGWHEVVFTGKSLTKAKLTLVCPDTAQGLLSKPQFDTNYTLQRYRNGTFVSIESSDEHRLDILPVTLELDADGYYCLCTGSRHPDGKAITRMEFFTLNKDSDNVKKVIVKH